MRRFLALGLAVGLALLFGACDLLLEEEDENEYVEIQLDTDYVNESIDADGFRFYTFVSDSAGSYTIRVTDLSSDVDWYLFENEVDINNINFLDAYEQGPSLESTEDEIGDIVLAGSVRYWLIVEESGGIDSSFDLRVDAPSPSGGVQEPSELDTMEFSYYGEGPVGAFNTDVLIYSLSTDDDIYFWLNDVSDSSSIDEGIYTLNTNSEAPGALYDVEIVADADSLSSTAGYIATTVTEDAYSNESAFATFDVYDQIVSGTVTVSISGSNYTFEWDFVSSDGDAITGSYTGPVDNVFDNS